jgi:hypothetical protein
MALRPGDRSPLVHPIGGGPARGSGERHGVVTPYHAIYRCHAAIDFKTMSSDDECRLRASIVDVLTYFYLPTCILYLSACAFFPEKIADSPTQNTCQISTPEWKLTFAEIIDVTVCQGSGKDAAYCLLAVGLVIPAGSFVVSGSIVIVGNTLHWLEYQGRCEDSFLQQQLALFKRTFQH